jgi:hypothetical protein
VGCWYQHYLNNPPTDPNGSWRLWLWPQSSWVSLLQADCRNISWRGEMVGSFIVCKMRSRPCQSCCGYLGVRRSLLPATLRHGGRLRNIFRYPSRYCRGYYDHRCHTAVLRQEVEGKRRTCGLSEHLLLGMSSSSIAGIVWPPKRIPSVEPNESWRTGSGIMLREKCSAGNNLLWACFLSTLIYWNV